MEPYICPRCGSGLVDSAVVNVSSKTSINRKDYVTIVHCTCELCLEEWVE
jgi:hypothetical protein